MLFYVFEQVYFVKFNDLLFSFLFYSCFFLFVKAISLF